MYHNVSFHRRSIQDCFVTELEVQYTQIQAFVPLGSELTIFVFALWETKTPHWRYRESLDISKEVCSSVFCSAQLKQNQHCQGIPLHLIPARTQVPGLQAGLISIPSLGANAP